MSCDVPTSLLCNNIFQSFGDFVLYPKFSKLVQFVIQHYNLFKYAFKNFTKVGRCQQKYMIHLYAKTHSCSLKNLSKTSSCSVWSSLVFCTATIFYLALVALGFVLIEVHSTKPLSPGDWTHWSIFGPCNNALYFLSRFGFLKNLHQGLFVFVKLTLHPLYHLKRL